MGSKSRIVLSRFADPDPKLFDPSPFTTKLECIFRMTATPYSVVKVKESGPKGKLPFIELEGKKIGDSTFCYKYLQEHEHLPDLDAHLDPTERALVVSHKAWIEEYCYFVLLWDRYIAHPKETKKGFFVNALPPAYRPFSTPIYYKIKKYLKTTLWNQGISRHSKKEILGIIEESARSLSILVGEKGILDGRSKVLNAIVLGFLVTVYLGPTMSAHWHEEIVKYDNLRTWSEKMIEEYFPERKLPELQKRNGMSRNGPRELDGSVKEDIM